MEKNYFMREGIKMLDALKTHYQLPDNLSISIDSFDSGFNLIGTIDIVDSIIINKSFDQIGDFEINTTVKNFLKMNRKLKQVGTYVRVSSNDLLAPNSGKNTLFCGVVTDIRLSASSEKSTADVIIRGNSLEHILKKRVLLYDHGFKSMTRYDILLSILNENLLNPSDENRGVDHLYITFPEEDLEDTTSVTHLLYHERIDLNIPAGTNLYDSFLMLRPFDSHRRSLGISASFRKWPDPKFGAWLDVYVTEDRSADQILNPRIILDNPGTIQDDYEDTANVYYGSAEFEDAKHVESIGAQKSWSRFEVLNSYSVDSDEAQDYTTFQKMLRQSIQADIDKERSEGNETDVTISASLDMGLTDYLFSSNPGDIVTISKTWDSTDPYQEEMLIENKRINQIVISFNSSDGFEIYPSLSKT